MQKILKTSILNDKKQLPEQSGMFSLSHQNDLLYVGYAANLRNKVSAFFSENPEDKNLLQLISLTDTVSYEPTENLFSAFILAKLAIDKHLPEFNNLIISITNYAYLGIDFHNPPFFKVIEDTQEELYYVGAFENRFVLFDFIDVMNALYKFPNCKDKHYPCHLLKEEKCDGYCLKDNADKAQLVIDNYIFPNFELINELEKKRQMLMTDLEFLQAELIKKQIKIIQKYYDRLKFLFVTKAINLEFEENGIYFKIKNGLIEELKTVKQISGFVISDIEYRDNEFLAIEKNKLAEAFLVYKKVKELFPRKIEELYEKTSERLRKKLK